jgi:hypothetical protein
MAFSLLSEIHKDSHQWSIRVLVSRMWHYRGGTDDGPIKHTDLVLLDVEVSATLPVLHECHGSCFQMLAYFYVYHTDSVISLGKPHVWSDPSNNSGASERCVARRESLCHTEILV